MNGVHSVAIVVHVVTAILGLGLTTAVAIAATFARKNQNAATAMTPLFSRYFMMISASLALMLLSGIALDVASNGAWHGALFFRLGVLLLVGVGALSGAARGRLRALAKSEGDAEASFARIGNFAWTMCGLVAVAAILMVLKPG